MSNVAFGGDWAEQIADREERSVAMTKLCRAAEAAQDVDTRRCHDVQSALHRACREHPKGALLVGAWRRAERLENSGERVREMLRVAKLIERGI